MFSYIYNVGVSLNLTLQLAVNILFFNKLLSKTIATFMEQLNLKKATRMNDISTRVMNKSLISLTSPYRTSASSLDPW